MKTYSEFITEITPCGCQDCDCNDNTVVKEEAVQLDEGVIDLFKAAVAKIMRRDAAAMIGKIEKATDKMKAIIKTAKEITSNVEKGKIVLKSEKDVDNFRTVAFESGLYNRAKGDRQERSEKDISRYIEVVIAKNKASQIKDSGIRDYFMANNGFLMQVNDNDYCSN